MWSEKITGGALIGGSALNGELTVYPNVVATHKEYVAILIGLYKKHGAVSCVTGDSHENDKFRRYKWFCPSHNHQFYIT